MEVQQLGGGPFIVLWDLLSTTAFQSPDVTTPPQVTAFAGTSLGVVNVCYVVAIVAMAIMIMGRDTIQSRYGPAELIPRLIIGLIAANLLVNGSSSASRPQPELARCFHGGCGVMGVDQGERCSELQG